MITPAAAGPLGHIALVHEDPDRERTGERMHSAGEIENRELIGVGIARALHITANEQRVILLRAFVKKTEKTQSPLEQE